MTKNNEKIRVYCGECRRNTNHVVIAKREVNAPADTNYHWGEIHYFCRCAGCDTYCYAISEWTEDDWNPHTDEIDHHWRTYPQSKNKHHPINDMWLLPNKVRVIYQEIIGAINAQLPVLTAIGLRALIEAICKEQGVKGSNLEILIDNLATEGILSQAQAEILHSHRFLGNIAAHEIVSAKPKELIAALEIAEAILKTIYILPELSNHIKTGKNS